MTVSIYEGEKTVSGGDGIEVTSNKVINLILRELNNLIKINSNNEVYVDLQLDDNLQSTSTIPVGVNVGRVLQANGFPATGTLITAKTTSGDTVKVLYGDDGEIRVDNGTGTWKIIQYELTAGNGISIVNNTITNTGVLSVNGQTGDVTVNSTPGVTYIVYDYGNNCYAVDEGDFKDGDLVEIIVESTDEPTDSINIDGNVIYINGYDYNNGWNWSS